MASVSGIAANYGYPTFIGNHLRCLSDVELWIKRYQNISGITKVCYQVEGGPEVCYEGDDYLLSIDPNKDYQGGQQPSELYRIAFFYKILFNNGQKSNLMAVNSGGFNYRGGTYDITLFYRSNGYVSGIKVQSKISPINWSWNYNFNSSYTAVGLVDWWIQPESLHYTWADDIRIGGNPDKYKIEIFKNNEIIHIFTSSKIINAWIETLEGKCTLQDSQWQKFTSWRQEPTDKLITWLNGDGLNFALESFFFGTPSTNKFTSKQPIGAVRQSYLVAILDKGDDCQFPLWQLKIKPLLGTECNPEPFKQCPPGKVWSEKLKRCIKEEKPRCPIKTHTQYECDGYLCCYDECGNLIASYKL